MPREETSESYSDDDEDQAASDAFDSVLESAVSALQDRWNGAIDHGKGLVSQNLSFLSAGQMLPPNVDTPISPSLPMSSFNPGQPLALALNPMQLQQLPLALASPAYIAHAGDDRAARLTAASAGDDYELLFAMPANVVPPVAATHIGRFASGEGLHLFDGADAIPLPARLGFQH